MKTIVSEKGQITIPKACRERLGIHRGTMLDIKAVDGQLVGSKIQSEDPFSYWKGKGKLPGGIKNVDDYLERVRAQ